MKENNLADNSKRLKRPRIQRATVPGESEKVNIQYEVKLFRNVASRRDVADKKLFYNIQVAKELDNS